MPEHERAYRTYKILGLLLTYPSRDLLDALDSLLVVLKEEALLSPEQYEVVQSVVNYFLKTELMTLQERFVALFDRRRLLSLHLFEHIYGESRERGQALVDLMEQYHEKGFELCTNETPDYLPLFLEFLSFLPKEEAKKMLAEPVNILASIGERLRKHQCPYHKIFDVLIELAEVELDNAVMEEIKKDYSTADPTHDEVDCEWKEAPVTFSEGSAKAEVQEQPMVYMPDVLSQLKNQSDRGEK